MTKHAVVKIIPNMALDDSHRLFLGIASYVMPRLKPEDREPLADIFNRFQAKGARDAAPQPQPRKDKPMPKDVGPENAIRAAMNFLRGKLSEEDIAELARIMAEGGSVDGSGDEPVTMAALGELNQARTETAPVLGAQANDMALDTAAKVYGEALRAMGVDRQGVYRGKELRAIYRTALNGRRATRQPLIAMDAKRAASLAERFPNAARIGGV